MSGGIDQEGCMGEIRTVVNGLELCDHKVDESIMARLLIRIVNGFLLGFEDQNIPSILNDREWFDAEQKENIERDIKLLYYLHQFIPDPDTDGGSEYSGLILKTISTMKCFLSGSDGENSEFNANTELSREEQEYFDRLIFGDDFTDKLLVEAEAPGNPDRRIRRVRAMLGALQRSGSVEYDENLGFSTIKRTPNLPWKLKEFTIGFLHGAVGGLYETAMEKAIEDGINEFIDVSKTRIGENILELIEKALTDMMNNEDNPKAFDRQDILNKIVEVCVNSFSFDIDSYNIANGEINDNLTLFIDLKSMKRANHSMNCAMGSLFVGAAIQRIFEQLIDDADILIRIIYRAPWLHHELLVSIDGEEFVIDCTPTSNGSGSHRVTSCSCYNSSGEKTIVFQGDHSSKAVQPGKNEEICMFAINEVLQGMVVYELIKLLDSLDDEGKIFVSRFINRIQPDDYKVLGDCANALYNNGDIQGALDVSVIALNICRKNIENINNIVKNSGSSKDNLVEYELFSLSVFEEELSSFVSRCKDDLLAQNRRPGGLFSWIFR